MPEFKFEVEFTDSDRTIFRITAEGSDGSYYNMMIDTWYDPYTLWYAGNKPENEDEFRQIIFDYMRNNYPDHF